MRANGLAIRLSLSVATILAVTCISSSLFAATVSAGGNVSAGATDPGADPIIGINDLGRLLVDGGATVTSDVAIVGDLFTGFGIVTISNSGTTGNGSKWIANSLMVGDEG